MHSDRWQQIKQLFNDALQREPSQRAMFLAEACAGDDELRAEVEELLDSYQTDFMDRPAVGEVADLILGTQEKLVSGQRVNQYEILKPIGAGGMGVVYLAQDTKLKRKVALKLLPHELTDNMDRLQRFEREAHAASALNHPNILTIHEIGVSNGATFIATEFIDGETLRQKIKGEQISLSDKLDLAIQVVSALAAAHEASIVHRDIKPENIMLRHDGIVKVLDFGLAKLTERRTEAVDTEAETKAQVKTELGMVMGTVGYMSPEQTRGLEIDARSDVWSLGVVLYEMLEGKTPFAAETPNDSIAAILTREPAPLDENTPAELQRIIRKSLQKKADERYQTVRDFFLDLKNLKH